MTNPEIVLKTEQLLASVLKDTAMEIYDIEFVKEGPNRFLRIYVDKEGGIFVDDCEFVSRKIEKLLDEENFIDQAYILEISSPGIERRPKRENLDRSVERQVK